MILGKEQHIHAACFEEIDEAVTLVRGGDSPVYFNAHAFPTLLPPQGIVYNLENVGIQVAPSSWPEHEIWDFSERNMEAWRNAGRDVKYVPIGYHHSMERFRPAPWEERHIDVIFCGCMNARRLQVLHEMKMRGLNVVHMSSALYGQERNHLLAHAKIGLNMLFYEEGTFPALRVAHLVANQIAVISENCCESWSFIQEQTSISELARYAETLIRDPSYNLEEIAQKNLQSFRRMPLILPAYGRTSSTGEI